MRFFCGPRLIVIDEFASARHNPDPEANTALFEVVSHRYLKSSTIVTSRAGIASWGERLADPTCPFGVVLDPGGVPERRVVPDVLAVQARELGHPLAVVVAPEAGHRAVHALS